MKFWHHQHRQSTMLHVDSNKLVDGRRVHSYGRRAPVPHQLVTNSKRHGWRPLLFKTRIMKILIDCHLTYNN